jgi:hypothetical protein
MQTCRYLQDAGPENITYLPTSFFVNITHLPYEHQKIVCRFIRFHALS